MPERSPRLDLPLIQPAQAQKHVTHNEALQQLDAVTQLVVVQFGAMTPPTLPASGDVYALGSGPTGAWAGRANELAYYDGTAWHFIPPGEGWRAWGAAEQELRIFTQDTWTAATEANLRLESLGVATEPDNTNRLSVKSEASLFSHTGAGHQLKLNKNTATDTASVVLQTDFDGHAEIGLAGNDNLSVKVSSDGAAWTESMVINNQTGTITGAAVQSNGTDATNGRLLSMGNFVGPFGLGSQRMEVTTGSLNELFNPGNTRFFSWTTGATDVPWNYGLGMQIVSFDTTGNQIVFRRGAEPGVAFRGTLDANLNFSDWMELYHTHNIVGTVGQSAGTPTGAVIERGSNANGEYVRFADGTQICTGSLTLDAANTASGSMFQGAASTAWNFPAAFATGTVPVVQASDTNIGGLWFSVYCAGESSASVRAMRAVLSNGTPVCRVVATGRWF